VGLLRMTHSGMVRMSLASDNIGADCFLCCPGPSLSADETAQLHRPGIITFAVNTAYPKGIARPDFWLGVDHPNAYDPRLWWEPFPKITLAGTHTQVMGGRYLWQAAMTFFAEHGRKPTERILEEWGPHVQFCYNANVFFFALHVLLWMGARRIRLLGCDMDNATADYCHGSPLTAEQRANNQKLYSMEAAELRRLAPRFKEKGVQLVSCTPGSPLNDFLPYMTLAEALDEAGRRVPQPFVQTPLHCRDAHMTQWQPIVEPEGVVVGVAPDQEDMLPWWWENYHPHNRLPVVFADFGMSKSWRQWCSERGRIVGVQNVAAVGWFRKGHAVLRSGLGRMLWLDLDTECRGDVSRLLQFAEGNGLGLGFDRIAEKHKADRKVPPETRMYDTGVIAVSHGDPIIPEWAAACTVNEHGVRGDQEVSLIGNAKSASSANNCTACASPDGPSPTH